MKKILALIVAVMMVGLIAYARGDEVTAECGPNASTPLTMTGIEKAQGLGEAMKRLADDDVSPLDVARAMEGMFDTVGYWRDAMVAAFNGQPAPKSTETWASKTAKAQQRAIRECCVAYGGQAVPGDPTPPTEGGGPSVAAVTVPGRDNYTSEQLSIAATAIAVGKANNIPEEGWVINIASGLVESGLRNLDYGDRDSVGYQQQRPGSGWGTVEEIRDPAKAAAAFYGVASHTSNPGLVDQPNWQSREPGSVAQAVQISAYPGKYAQRIPEARRIVAMLTGAAAAPAAFAPSEPGDPAQETPQDPTTPQQTLPPGCYPATNSNVQGSVGAMTITTWNVLRGNDQISAGVKALAKSDVISLQEVGNDEDQAAARNALKATHTMSRFNSAVPIMWRTKKYDVLSQTQTLAIPEGTRVEPSRGGSLVGPKYITEVKLRDKATSKVFIVGNTHMLMGASEKAPKRLARYQSQMAQFVEKATAAKASGIPFLGTCDCNGGVTKTKASSALQAIGATSNWETFEPVSTHGKTTIDYVWSVGALPASQSVGPKRGSDHSPVSVTYAGPVAGTALTKTSADFSKYGGQRSVDEAIAWLERMVNSQTPVPVSSCLRQVGLAYGHNSTAQVDGHFYAIGVWTAMAPERKHVSATEIPPRGALVFWDTTNVAEHIGVSAGDGYVYTTDSPTRGRIGKVKLEVLDGWGPRLGWTDPYFAGHTTIGVKA